MSHQPFFVPAVIFLIIAIPLILGIIPKNNFYGIRTKKTLSSDSVWLKSNKFGGWSFIFSSLIYLVYASFFPMADVHDKNSLLWFSHFCVFLGSIVVSLVLTLWYTGKLKE